MNNFKKNIKILDMYIYTGLYMLYAMYNIFMTYLEKKLTDMGESILHFEAKDMDIDEICSDIYSFIMRTGKKPIVIIDHIDSTIPSMHNGCVKSDMDRNISKLRKFQLENDILIICTCCLKPEEFHRKYCYAIEYIVDIVWEFRVSGSKSDMLNDQQRKIMMQKEKDNSCIYFELLNLKNKIDFISYFFEYDPSQDTLIPIEFFENPI